MTVKPAGNGGFFMCWLQLPFPESSGPAGGGTMMIFSDAGSVL